VPVTGPFSHVVLLQVAPRGIVAAATAASVTSTLVALTIDGAGGSLPATFLVIAGTAPVYMARGFARS
jgi:NhaP-type Na+/H+ or K+/H+ antiporter